LNLLEEKNRYFYLSIKGLRIMPHAISGFAREALSPSLSRDLFEKSTGTKILLTFSMKNLINVERWTF